MTTRMLLTAILAVIGVAGIGCDDEVAEVETPQGEIEVERD